MLCGFSPILKIIIPLAVFLLPTFFVAEVQDSAKIAEANKTIFFVSPNVRVHGTVYIQGEKTEGVKKNAVLKRPDKAKQAAGILAQMRVKELHNTRIYQKIQKQISSRIKYFYTPSSSQQFSRSKHDAIESFIISGSNTVSYITSQTFFTVLKIQLSKQKFCSFFAFTPFSQLLDSFLRGPPHFFCN